MGRNPEPTRDEQLAICHGARELIQSKEVQFLFQQMKKDLFAAFEQLNSGAECEKVMHQLKAVNGLINKLEHYANGEEYYGSR